MAQSVVGDYAIGKQIGVGSFSTVWLARHRIHGTEVAIKEIVTSRLNPKLKESLKSEIFILKRINHPNIIRLLDMIEESGKIYIVLEYCRGGDLSMYIQQHQRRIPEATAKYFMQQLAEGLKVLRQNNLIHRDLKPQNLLLSSDGDNSILKIADFGFARSLQPRGLAETLCGSPLYMAPEIMQLQKYDAKADLWSVGAILFQLVTGRTPFTGSNQIQLLQNIIKASELQFPPEAKDLSLHCIDLCKKLLRRNPVERLTFEEFFNHPFLSQRQPDESVRNRQSERVLDGFPLCDGHTEQGPHEDCLPVGNTEQSLHEDCLPFTLDDDPSGPVSSPSFQRKSMVKYTYGFSPDPKPDWRDVSKLSNRTDLSKYIGASARIEFTESNLGGRCLSDGNLKVSLKTTDFGPPLDNHPQKVMDSLESIVKDYVIVSGPPVDLPSSAHAYKPSHCPPKFGSPPLYSRNVNSTPSAPVPIIGGASGRVDRTGGIESQLSSPGISQGSMNMVVNFEQPSTDYMTRISSLQCSASAITELVNNRIEGGKQLQAFSIQLVILATWKQALHICHTHAASAMEGSPSKETTRLRQVSEAQHRHVVEESPDTANRPGPLEIYQKIERAFLHEVVRAEELAKVIEPGGERKRVSIGVDVIHDPPILLLDEPTSGLDSSSALQVIELLSSMARAKQRTIVLSIHQPSYRILQCISSFLILSHGSVVHNGSLESLELAITRQGFRIPPQINPLEFSMEIILTLEESYSKYYSSGVEQKEEYTTYPPLQVNEITPADSLLSRLFEITVLCSRFWKIIYRTKQLLLARTMQALVGGFGLGSVYVKVRKDEGGVAERLGLFAFSLSFLLSSTVEALPIYLQERHVLMKEASRGSYRVSSYLIANTIVFFPFLFIVAILFSVPLYWIVGLNPSLSAFAFFTFVVWLIVLMASSLVLFLSVISPDFISGNSLIGTALGAFFLFSGYFIPKEFIPKYWLFMYYVSLYRYPLDSLLLNEYWSERNECFSTRVGDGLSACLLTGNDVLKSRGLEEDTRWINVGIMLAFFVFYRLLSWIVLARKVAKTTL